jgi:putative ABC transport system permease protein
MLHYAKHIKEGLLNLYFAKLRSILALLGVLVGTASVVAMVLGGQLATNEALKQFKSLGTDLLAVTINSGTDVNHLGNGREDNINLNQALSLKNVNDNILQAAPYTQLFNSIFYNGQSINGMVLGVQDSFADIVRIQLQQGRFISFLDKYEFYCVIGHDIYNAMKDISFKEPLGQQLQIGKNIFVIVGVADPWPENGFIYTSIDNAIMVPILTSLVLSKYAAISNIIMRLTPHADIPKVEEQITSAVNQIISGKQVNYRSAKELISKMKKQSDILTVFLGLIGSISLFVGGIGVMNIMLVSVIERKREIGIRLAIGARRSDIRLLFLIEAIVLSLIGGTLGVVIGILIAYIISAIWHWQFTLFLLPPLVGFSVSVAVGIFFGFYPAYLASKLDPIEALRSE